VGPTWPIFTTAIAAGAGAAAGAATGAASSFLPQATSNVAAANTVNVLFTLKCIKNSQNLKTKLHVD
jgi:predicted nicotinamide N-methyase